MNSLIRPAVSLFVLLTAVTGVVYPLVVTGALPRRLFRSKPTGSLIEKDGKLVGSTLIGQNFSSPQYFWGRPSATGPQPYNASASSGSNQGPTESGPGRCCQGTCPNPARRRPEKYQADSAGTAECLRQRPRPAHQPQGRRLPARARCPRTQARPSSGPQPGRSQYRRP